MYWHLWYSWLCRCCKNYILFVFFRYHFKTLCVFVIFLLWCTITYSQVGMVFYGKYHISLLPASILISNIYISNTVCYCYELNGGEMFETIVSCDYNYIDCYVVKAFWAGFQSQDQNSSHVLFLLYRKATFFWSSNDSIERQMLNNKDLWKSYKQTAGLLCVFKFK